MRTIFPLLFSVLFTLVSCTKPIDDSLESKADKLPADFMFDQRAYPTGVIKSEALREAIQWKKQQLQQRSVVGNSWEFAGPVNIGGRITDIEIPSNEAQTYYVGAASGGIFKTTDAGASWVSIFDDQEMLSIGDIEVSKVDNDVIWVGTGEVNAGGGSLAYDGDGIYKSEDGGQTWESKGLPDIGSVGKVLIDPNDENTLFVAAMGPLFRNDNNRGVYRSTDGGNNWEQKLFVSDSTGVIDMAIHPTNGDIVYAATWERIRRPNNRQYGGETSGLYRSSDGGENWTELTAGLPTAPSQKGRISIDISQSNPNVLYARYANASGDIQGVYRTSNGGDTWTAVNSNQLTNIGFHWWFRGIFVDPTDENTIYNVDFIVEKSTDGGQTWFTSFPDVHVDQHALAFNNSVSGEVVLGNDGGFYKSNNGGSSWAKDETLPITQIYRTHVDFQNENKVYIGTQDNSTIRTTTGSANDWNIINGGDGFQPLVDPTNTSVIYALSQRGFLVKSTNDGASFSPAMAGIASGDRKNWDTPIVFDPQDSQTLYYGANRLYKTTNAAGSWTPISDDLSNGPYSGNLDFGTIISIDVSPLNSDLIYVGTDDGNVWVTEDGGEDWTLVSDELPNRWVTKVLASREDENVVYVTFSGYRYGADEGHVYRSNNKGVTWFDISGSLPDIPVNDIVQDANGYLYVGTDVGVFASATSGQFWEVVGDNLPSVVVTDMHIHEPSQYLYAGTYGRSLYKTDVSDIILGSEGINEVVAFSMYPNPAVSIVMIEIREADIGAELYLYDVNGRLIREMKFEDRVEVEVSDLNSGIYFVTVKSEVGKQTKKLIVN
ncbi:T9SS type A sorting domain-containing protein [Aureitalea sp. L0-47]|uniref:VPS10 domain-containing protein n=1 Tax=Aureitalea sp. L0-47 TaxID=2816962 RepID=UPI0022377584|nr:T9SS type A sorting domain-containing protein [Aureitalea sp. L0-47]MCW5520197.1 T9SS type A sorting domain-containing protein [Aureitalea sp. L0-47]